MMITLGFGPTRRYADIAVRVGQGTTVAICVSQQLVMTPNQKPSGDLFLIENRRTGFDIRVWLHRLGSHFSRTIDKGILTSRIYHVMRTRIECSEYLSLLDLPRTIRAGQSGPNWFKLPPMSSCRPSRSKPGQLSSMSDRRVRQRASSSSGPTRSLPAVQCCTQFYLISLLYCLSLTHTRGSESGCSLRREFKEYFNV
jgi:hypothetical protein